MNESLPMHKDTYFFGYGIDIDKPIEMANKIISLKEENKQLKERQKEFMDYLDAIILYLENDIKYYKKNYTPTGKYLKETRTNQYNQLLQIKAKYEEIIRSDK